MKVRATTRLLEAGRIYVAGEVFETSPERAAALGNSVVILEEPKKEEKKAKKKEAKAKFDKMVKKAESKKV